MHKLQELCKKAAAELETIRSFDTAAFPSVASIYTQLLLKTLSGIHREIIGLNAETHVLQTLTGTVLVEKGSYIAAVLEGLAELNRALCFDLSVPACRTLPPASSARVAEELQALRSCAWDELTRGRSLQETLRVYAILAEYPAGGDLEADQDVT